MKYKIEIAENLRRIVEIEADDKEEAITKVRSMYFNEDIVLTEADCEDYWIEIVDYYAL